LSSKLDLPHDQHVYSQKARKLDSFVAMKDLQQTTRQQINLTLRIERVTYETRYVVMYSYSDWTKRERSACTFEQSHMAPSAFALSVLALVEVEREWDDKSLWEMESLFDR